MNSLQTAAIPYSPDSAPLMNRLVDLPFPVFLDSCSHNPRGGRYDILSAAPIATVEIANGALTSSVVLPQDCREDVFRAARFLLDKHRPDNPDSSHRQPLLHAPFDGGLMGVLGYPALSGAGEMRVEEGFMGVYPWALVVDHEECQSRLIFQTNCPPETRDAVLNRLQDEEKKIQNFSLLENFSNNLSRSEYNQSFDRIKGYISAGDCYQVNLTQRFSAAFCGHPFAAYRRLRHTTGKPFSAYLSWQDRALLCLSPERFIEVQDRRVTTQPIKGTRPRSSDPAEDRRLAQALAGSEKDRAENLMIVDLLRNDLGTVCETGSIQVTGLFELQAFDNVFHLVSTIQGLLPDNVSPLELMRNCYPGGSVTGAPKLRAMEIIEELETRRREIYCGNVLMLGFNGRFDSNITIRSLYCRDQEICCWAGGGIVADSECDQEYHECFDKIYSLINTLQD